MCKKSGLLKHLHGTQNTYFLPDEKNHNNVYSNLNFLSIYFSKFYVSKTNPAKINVTNDRNNPISKLQWKQNLKSLKIDWVIDVRTYVPLNRNLVSMTSSLTKIMKKTSLCLSIFISMKILKNFHMMHINWKRRLGARRNLGYPESIMIP